MAAQGFGSFLFGGLWMKCCRKDPRLPGSIHVKKGLSRCLFVRRHFFWNCQFKKPFSLSVVNWFIQVVWVEGVFFIIKVMDLINCQVKTRLDNIGPPRIDNASHMNRQHNWLHNWLVTDVCYVNSAEITTYIRRKKKKKKQNQYRIYINLIIIMSNKSNNPTNINTSTFSTLRTAQKKSTSKIYIYMCD